LEAGASRIKKMNTRKIPKTGTQTYNPKREGTYKPRISPAHLRGLWLLKQKTGKPITELVSDALNIYFKINGKEVK
jgi:hypothetical protein